MIVFGGLNASGPGASSSPVFSGTVTGLYFQSTANTGSTWMLRGPSGLVGIGNDAGTASTLFYASGAAQWYVSGATGALQTDLSRNLSMSGGTITCSQVSSQSDITVGTAGSGDLIAKRSVLIQMGTSASNAYAGGVATANYTGVGNVGASGPDDLQTYTLPANSLIAPPAGVAARGLRIRAWGTTANNANAKTVRLTIGPGPTALITKQLTASIAGFWEIECTILRTGSNAQDFFAKAINYGGTTVSSTDGATVYSIANVGTLTQTETNALDIKVQSTVSTSNNDIVSEGLIVEFI